MSESKKPSADYVSITETDRWRDWKAFKGKRESDRDSDPFAQRERELKIEISEARLADLKARTSDRDRKQSDRDHAGELAEAEARAAELETIDRDMLEKYHGAFSRFFLLGTGAIFAVILIAIGGFTIMIVIGILLSLIGIKL